MCYAPPKLEDNKLSLLSCAFGKLPQITEAAAGEHLMAWKVKANYKTSCLCLKLFLNYSCSKTQLLHFLTLPFYCELLTSFSFLLTGKQDL